MKPIDDEGRSAKLDSLKELLKAFKESSLQKLPKGKGVSMMSVSVSKPKKEDMEMEDEDLSEEMSPEAEETMEEDMMPEAEGDMDEEMEEDEDEYELPEPSVPSDLMDLVKEMLMRKKEEK
jgi:hypothetical protein